MKVRIIEENGRFYPQKYGRDHDGLEECNPWEYFYAGGLQMILSTKLYFYNKEAAKQFLLAQSEQKPPVVEEFEV